MNSQRQTGLREGELSPHLRQRVAFMAALIPDSESANWAAISDTWDNLSQETKGTALESKGPMIREAIRRQDAPTLAHAIGDLLRDSA
jgi:hypothetical protein